MTTQTARVVAGVAPGLLPVRSGLAARMRMRAASRQLRHTAATLVALACMTSGLLAVSAGAGIPAPAGFLAALLATWAITSYALTPPRRRARKATT